MLYETRPIDDSIKDGRILTVACSLRWLPYKNMSEQYRKGITGRWQIANEYGWENLQGDPPEVYLAPIQQAAE